MIGSIESILKNEEKAVLALRSLYRSYGYLPFKMSKFEEYDLYVRNKDFLISDGIITFNDTNGKLLALKPDMTLSIVKNAEDRTGCKQKLCYDENVYRISGSTHRYKELMQAGLECIGDIDMYDILEVTTLAVRSLSLLSDDYILAISHPGILSSALEGLGLSAELKSAIVGCFAEKNAHDLRKLCTAEGVGVEGTELLCGLISIFGDIGDSLNKLDVLCPCSALDELRSLASLLSKTEYGNKIRIDTSLVSDTDYYNGFVFKGFLSGACESVLTGGQYGKLLRRMGRRSDAIGFAIYLDRLEGIDRNTPDFDVDVLLIYSKDTDASAVAAKTAELIASGKSVSAQKAIPPKLRYRELIELKGGN